MSTNLDKLEQPVELSHVSPELRDFAAEHLAMRAKHVLACVWFAAFFIYLSHVPLFHTDLWGHVAYGDWIIEHGRLPVEDPFLQLAEGVTLIDSAWLGQVIFAAVEHQGGSHWLSYLFAVVGLVTSLTVAAAMFVRTRRFEFAVGASILVLILSATRLAIMRTEVFGGLCFALIMLCIAACHRPRQPQRTRALTANDCESMTVPWWAFIVVPLVMLFWANVHGSFVVGLAVIGCCLLGRIIEVAWQTWSLRAVLIDGACRRWLLLTELATAATLINPYGMDLLVNTFLFAGHPNLQDVLEWKKLPLISAEGILFSFSWVLMLVLVRFSRRRVQPAEVLMLAVFNVAVIGSVRMIGWYAVVFVYAMIPHMLDVADRLLSAVRTSRPQHRETTDEEYETVGINFAGPSLIHTALCLLFLWCGFAFSPLGNTVLGGQQRPAEKLYSSMTPRALTDFLCENPPEGQVWNPQWWGDWLVWDGPADIQVFMTTNACHVAPHRVWRDYLHVARAAGGWATTLDRYAVQTIIVHKELQTQLAEGVRTLQGWNVIYEDELALVVKRDEKPQTTAEHE